MVDRVVVGVMPALKFIPREDTEGTLFYCDPPYLHDADHHRHVYAHEMTERDHRDLLAVLCQCKGKVMLSGYRNNLYDKLLSSWTLHTFDMPNHAAGGAEKRRMTECLWTNF